MLEVVALNLQVMLTKSVSSSLPDLQRFSSTTAPIVSKFAQRNVPSKPGNNVFGYLERALKPDGRCPTLPPVATKGVDAALTG